MTPSIHATPLSARVMLSGDSTALPRLKYMAEKITDGATVYSQKLSFTVGEFSSELRFGLSSGDVFYFAYQSSSGDRVLLQFAKATNETSLEYLNYYVTTDQSKNAKIMRLHVAPDISPGVQGESTILFSATNGGAAVVVGRPGVEGVLKVSQLNNTGTGRMTPDMWTNLKESAGCVDALTGIPITEGCTPLGLVSSYEAFLKLDGRKEGKDLPEVYPNGWNSLATNPVIKWTSGETLLTSGLDEN